MTQEEQLMKLESDLQALQAVVSTMKDTTPAPKPKPTPQGLTDDELLEIAVNGDIADAQSAINEASKR